MSGSSHHLYFITFCPTDDSFSHDHNKAGPSRGGGRGGGRGIDHRSPSGRPKHPPHLKGKAIGMVLVFVLFCSNYMKCMSHFS